MALPFNNASGSGRGRGEGWGRGRGGGFDAARGRGRGRGGLSEQDKAAISAASRPATTQITSECTDDVIVAAAVTGGTAKHFAFTALRDDFTHLSGHRQMRMFVNSCLLNLSNHHSADTTGILAGLSKPSGIARLTEIMEERMHVDAGDSRNLVSFQYVMLPLIGVLTREKVCRSTMTSETGIIYARVYEHRKTFFEQGVLPCMDELLERGSLKDRNPTAMMVLQDPSVCRVTSLQCAMIAVVRLVYQLIRRIREAPTTMAPLVDKLYEQTTLCISLREVTPENVFPSEILAREVDRLRKITADAQNKILEPKVSANALPAAGPSRPRAVNMMHIVNEYDPPGELSPKGRRHDNDHVEISEISVLPTLEEVICQRGAYLPSNDIPEAPHFLPHGWSRQIDIHFRLYREDMMDSLRKGITAFLSALHRTENGDEGILLKHKELKKRLDDNVNLNVYGNVQFLGMNCKHKSGGSVKISFTQPSQLTGTSKSRRVEFWERSKRRLMQGSLICIASRTNQPTTDDTGIPNFQMVLGVVTVRDSEALGQDDSFACIEVSLADPKEYVRTLGGENSGNGASSQWFLVEATGSFFESYRPILQALQNCVPGTLPFGKYLAPTKEEMEAVHTARMCIDPPMYTRAPGFVFDLSILLRARMPCQLDVKNSESVKLAVAMLQRYSDLDDTQAQALVDTLCREVALIRGPPGTGKTKIGVDLMRVLLHNRKAMGCGPIVCICYTNHALDQFLEHMLDEGITSIARIGSRSKAERLDSYNLESMMKMNENRNKGFHVRQELYSVRDQRKVLAEEITKLEDALRSEYLAWEYIGSFLMIRSPDMWEQFEFGDSDLDYGNGDQDDDEESKAGGEKFTEVKTRRRRLNPYERWASGQDIKDKEARNKDIKGWREKDHVVNRFNFLDADQLELYQAPTLEHIPNTNRSLEELQDADVWCMSMKERRLLIASWRSVAQQQMMEKMAKLLQSMETISKRESDAYDQIRLEILRTKSVIGMTTNGAAKSQGLFGALAPSIIICEEAGEVLESHILAALSPSTQHLILIGDHEQLRPQIECYHLSSDSKNGEHHNLDRSLFERLVRARKNAVPASELTIQRRMRPEISSLIRNAIYPRLVDGEKVLAYPDVVGMGSNLFFMDHTHSEDSKDQYGMQSFTNSFEVKMVEALAQYLIRNGYDKPGDIAILTPYLGQLSRLRDHLRNKFELLIDERDQEQLDQNELDNAEHIGSKDGGRAGLNINQHATVGVKKVSMNSHITLRTIDNYQGEEAKIVIISLVRNTGPQTSLSSYNTIGFLKSPNRANVLLSRAKHGMFLLGNAGLMRQERNGIWPKVIEELDRNGRIDKGFRIICKNHPNTRNIIETPEALRTVAPNGGCTVACGRNMPCGHVCPLSSLSSVAPSLPARLPEALRCYEDATGVQCKIVCGAALECGHTCLRTCHTCQSNKAKLRQMNELPHANEVSRLIHGECLTRLERTLFCGHAYSASCNEPRNSKPACKETCEFCVECKDPKTMLVDMILQESLGEIDVDQDPILHLPCGHALTMSSLDGMMEMSEYYAGDTDPNTGLIAFKSKKPLPDGLTKQASCHLCRKPIVGLLRYGRRVKYAQLTERKQKFQLAQVALMAKAQDQLLVAKASTEQHQVTFLQSIKKTKAEIRPDPPEPRTRKLGKFAKKSKPFPNSEFLELSKVYGIPEAHEAAWKTLLKWPMEAFRQFLDLALSALRSPTRQLFEAAVSHLYRAKTSPTMHRSQNRRSSGQSPELASDVIQACILECGLPLDGQVGSSYVDSLHGLTNVLLVVLAQAFAAFSDVEASSGWYWFIEDLLTCAMAYAHLLLEAAEKGRFERHKAYARVIRMDLSYRRMQWLGRKAMPSDEEAKKQRFKRVDKVLALFMSDLKAIKGGCPLGIIEDCTERSEALEAKIIDAYNVARGEALYNPLTAAEKAEVFTAMQQTLSGSGHWYTCPNGHSYVIADCGMAMETSRCFECGLPVGGSSHQLLQTNRINEEYEALHRQRAT
ncbi:hypothetical protein BGZ70_001435 [Mortierella alpina]|uniref:RZ-type domain-containing protein n=1 Tax=Mortierella alpina TaxID=64518 RepID=A0A9P6JCC6_MORAP|nr:hypothetical protein BGZ70_001435 [Mortierella alpina]